jgi:AcrR family transcriptional regulator
LFQAADTIFVRDGYEGAELGEIAALAGRTKGAIYAQFKSKEDIFLALVEEKIKGYRSQMEKMTSALRDGGLENRLSATETMDGLVRYRWPGNIRELQNFVERAVILSPHSVLRAPTSELEPFNSHREFRLPISGLAQVERDHILHAL